MSDYIRRDAVIDLMRTNWADYDGDTAMQLSIDGVRELPGRSLGDEDTKFLYDAERDCFVAVQDLVNENAELCGHKVKDLITLAQLAEQKGIKTDGLFTAYQQGYEDGQKIKVNQVENAQKVLYNMEIGSWNPMKAFDEIFRKEEKHEGT